MSVLEFALVWWLIGAVGISIAVYVYFKCSGDDVKVKDILAAAVAACLGPIVWILLVLVTISRLDWQPAITIYEKFMNIKIIYNTPIKKKKPKEKEVTLKSNLLDI